MVDPELLELMPSTVSMAPLATRNGAGEITPAVAISARCRIEYAAQYVTGSPANTVFADGVVYLDDVYPVTEAWTLVLPDAGPTNGKVIKIVKVEQLNDENGPYSTVLYFGAT